MAECRRVLSRFGRLDILINNAGINTRRDRVPIHEYKLEDWNKILVDLTGVFVTSRTVPLCCGTNEAASSTSAPLLD
jgi:NAD(P)-dependent dehydrogenase (short-subunit alcohol dehydrogenase family)